MGDQVRHARTVPVAENSNESLYGVAGLSCNTWEWTDSSFFRHGTA